MAHTFSSFPLTTQQNLLHSMTLVFVERVPVTDLKHCLPQISNHCSFCYRFVSILRCHLQDLCFLRHSACTTQSWCRLCQSAVQHVSYLRHAYMRVSCLLGWRSFRQWYTKVGVAVCRYMCNSLFVALVDLRLLTTDTCRCDMKSAVNHSSNYDSWPLLRKSVYTPCTWP